MSAAGGAYPIVPPLPEYEHRSSTTGPTTGKDTKTEQLSDEQRSKLQASRDVTEREIKATEERRALREREAEIARQDAELQGFAVEAQENLRTGPEAQAAKAYVDWARKRTQDEEARLSAMPPPRYFKSGDGWTNVRKAVGLALAGFGDGMMASAAIRAGHAPQSGHTVSDIIERDLAQQRAAIDKQKDTVLMARTGLSDAVEARRAVMAELDLKAKHMFRQAEMLTRARLAALKMPQAAIDQTKEVLELQRKQADSEAEYVKGHTTTVNNRWDSAKTTNETINRAPVASHEGKIPGQQSALARQAINELDKLEAAPLPSDETLKKLQDNALVSSAADTAIEGGKPLSGTVSLVGRAADAIPRNRYEGLPEQDRITAQTMDRAKQLLMHVMTGAGASVEEAKQKAEAFGWVPGDTPKSMKAKIAGAKELAQQFISTEQPAAKPAETAKETPARGPSIQGTPRSDFTTDRVATAKRKLEDKGTSPEQKKRFREYLIEARKAGFR